MSNVWIYVLVLLAVVLAFAIIKKVAGCMLKMCVLLVLVVVVAILYWIMQA